MKKETRKCKICGGEFRCGVTAKFVTCGGECSRTNQKENNRRSSKKYRKKPAVRERIKRYNNTPEIKTKTKIWRMNYLLRQMEKRIFKEKSEEIEKTESGRNAAEVWDDLEDIWEKYKKARNAIDKDAIKTYASAINALQKDLGVRQSRFPEIA